MAARDLFHTTLLQHFQQMRTLFKFRPAILIHKNPTHHDNYLDKKAEETPNSPT